MAVFKSYQGKKVATPSGVLEFKLEQLETSDKAEIEALSKAKDVAEVKSEVKQAKK